MCCRSVIFDDLPANHRASGCALEARRMAIDLSDELQERGMQGLHGRVWQFGRLPANHRASGCALERCLKGFATLDGHKLTPSRERMCPGVLSRGVWVARWTQIDAIARANVPCRPLEWRLPCQMICGKARNRALTAVRGRLGFFLQTLDLQRGSPNPRFVEQFLNLR